MHRHDVETTGQFRSPAFREGAEDIQGNFIAAVDEFIGNAHTILNLDGHDGLGPDLAAAGRLGARFGYDVNVVVHIESEVFLAVERNRLRAAHGGQGAVAFDLVQKTGYQLSREKGSTSNRIRSIGKTHCFLPPVN